MDQKKHERRQRRRGSGESALGAKVDASGETGLAAVIGNEPAPEFAVAFVEETRRLLKCLEDDELREVAICRLEGYTNVEIAARLCEE
jgi:DNA-directed RNA polymerase specialized sigma24 family protein